MGEKNLRILQSSPQEEITEDRDWVLAAPEMYRLGLFWKAGTLPRTLLHTKGSQRADFRATACDLVFFGHEVLIVTLKETFTFV